MNDILVKIGADITDFSRKMAESNRALQDFGRANQQTFDSFKKVGAASVAAGAAIAVGLGSSVKTAANFESAMSSVAAISGATGKDFELLSAKAREMGASTSFSASEAAEGLEYMALAGWDTKQMLGGIEPILHLAEAGALDLGRASDLVTDSMSALGLEVKDLDGYLDQVAKTASSANTDIDALMEAFVIAGGTFERFNVPLAEANAFLGVMANRGFKGSEAGTALNAIMTRLTASTGPSAKALKELGVNAFDAEGNFRGMEVVMKEVESALSELSDEERAHYQTQIAGLNHGKAFSAMLSGLGNEYDDLKDEILDSNGALKEMRDIMKDNLQGALENLSSAFEEMQIALGTALLPAIKVLVKGLQFLADKFNALPDSVKSFIAIGLALSSVLLIVGGGLLLLIGFIPQIITGFAALKTVVGLVAGAISSPILIVVGAIAGLVAALVVAYKKSETFRDVVHNAFNAVKDIVSSVINIVVEYVKNIWGGLIDWWSQEGDRITQAASNVWNFVLTTISTIMPAIEAVMRAVWTVIKSLVISTWEAIKNVIDGALNVVLGIVKVFSSLLTGDWSGLWAGIKQITSGLLQVIWGVINLYFIGKILKVGKVFAQSFSGVFTTLWAAIRSIFTNSVRAVSNVTNAGFTAIRAVVTGIMRSIQAVITAVWNAIRSVVTGSVSSLRSVVSNGFKAMTNAIRSSMSSALGAVRSIFSRMMSVGKSAASSFVGIGRDIVRGMISGIKNMAGAAVDAITGVVGGVVNKAKSMLKIKSPSRVLMEIGKWTSLGLAEGIEDYAYRVDNAAETLAQSAIPDVDTVSLSYQTPAGVRSTLSSAVSGTVDVNSRDSAVVAELKQIRGELANQRQMIVELDGRQVGRTVTPYIDEGLSDRSNRRKAAWGGA